MGVSVANAGAFLKQPRVTEAVAEGLADAAAVPSQAVNIVEFTMPSLIRHGGNGKQRGGEGTLQFAYDIAVPEAQADSAKHGLKLAKKHRMGEKINQVLSFHGADLDQDVQVVSLNVIGMEPTQIKAGQPADDAAAGEPGEPPPPAVEPAKEETEPAAAGSEATNTTAEKKESDTDRLGSTADTTGDPEGLNETADEIVAGTNATDAAEKKKETEDEKEDREEKEEEGGEGEGGD